MGWRRGCLWAFLVLVVLVAAALVVTVALPRLKPQPSAQGEETPPLVAVGSPTRATATTRLRTATPKPPATVGSPTRATATPRSRTATPSPRPSATAGPDGTVTADTLNVRAGPDTSFARVTQVHRGDGLAVVGRTASGDWLSVVTPDGKDGWVAAAYVDLQVETASIPVVADIPPTPAPAEPTPTLTVDEQIAKVAGGQHGQLPPPSRTGGVGAGGLAEVTIINDTKYELTILIGSPNAATITLDPCPTCKDYVVTPLKCAEDGRARTVVRLQPGSSQVVARVSNPSVAPFYGVWDLQGDTAYFNCFFIITRFSR